MHEHSAMVTLLDSDIDGLQLDCMTSPCCQSVVAQDRHAMKVASGDSFHAACPEGGGHKR
jgi:hypothetical protein